MFLHSGFDERNKPWLTSALQSVFSLIPKSSFLSRSYNGPLSTLCLKTRDCSCLCSLFRCQILWCKHFEDHSPGFSSIRMIVSLQTLLDFCLTMLTEHFPLGLLIIDLQELVTFDHYDAWCTCFYLHTSFAERTSLDRSWSSN